MFQTLTVRRDGGLVPVKSQVGPAGRGRPITTGWACRTFDIAVAVLALLFAAPLLAAVAIAVKMADGGPALFGHERIGVGGRPFRCLKFRSMVMDADVGLAQLLEADPRRPQRMDAGPQVAQ